MEAFRYEPGDLVLLKEPFRPEFPSTNLLRIVAGALHFPGYTQYEMYRVWDGFTHGMIAQRYGKHQVSLFLYDPHLGILHIAVNNIPTYVDFSLDEVVPFKDGRTVGYYSTVILEGKEEE